MTFARRWLVLGGAALLLVGWMIWRTGGEPAGGPEVPAAGPPVADGAPSETVSRIRLVVTEPLPAPAAPKAPPPPGLTQEVPTYPASPRERWQVPSPVPHPASPGGLEELERIARQIEETGSPEPPPGASAVLVGALEGGRYAYYLGGPPRPDQPHTYLLHRGPSSWSATPICEGARWIWSGTRSQKSDPVVICGASEGSGNVLSLDLYRADRHLLRLGGILEGRVEVRPRPEGPPDLVVTGKLQWMEHKLDPWVTERFTYRWVDGEYRQVGHERMADRNYRLARFVKLLEAGELERAAGEMAAPPPGGLAAYLEQHAPELPGLAGSAWTTDGFFHGDRVYIHPVRTERPWFWFQFAPDGRIAAVGQQEAQPARE
ncbi:MAG: hypothetical protein ACOY93_01355 [Bacillota bacterium]